jgi:hypothetical protein
VLFHNFDRFLIAYERRFEKEYGYFRPIIRLPRLDDARLAEIFGREVLALLVSKGLLSPECAERILSWRHTGFNVHSRVRARTKAEVERVGKYMVRYYGPYANAYRGKVRKAIRRRRLPPVGIWVVDTCPRPEYPYFVRRRVDLEREAGDFEPGEKRNFLSEKQTG